jgi:hypothetical protein
MVIKILNIVILFVMYFFVEVYHDYAVSKNVKQGTEEWNKEWHKFDLFFHFGILLLMWLNAGWLYALLVITSRGLLFDKHFAWKWKRDIFYVGEHEPDWKKKNSKLIFYINLFLYLANVLLIIKYA